MTEEEVTPKEEGQTSGEDAGTETIIGGIDLDDLGPNPGSELGVAKTISGWESKPEPEPEPEPKTEPDPDPETDPEPDPNPEPELDPESEPEPEMDPDPDPETESDIKAKAKEEAKEEKAKAKAKDREEKAKAKAQSKKEKAKAKEAKSKGDHPDQEEPDKIDWGRKLQDTGVVEWVVGRIVSCTTFLSDTWASKFMLLILCCVTLSVLFGMDLIRKDNISAGIHGALAIMGLRCLYLLYSVARKRALRKEKGEKYDGQDDLDKLLSAVTEQRG